MSNVKLIKALRCKTINVNDCTLCAYHNACYDGTLESIAADELEADEKFIAEFIKNIELLKKQVARLRAQLPKEGKWITMRTWNHDGEIYCSICDHDAPTDGDYRQVKTSYCPNCGARMREGEEWFENDPAMKDIKDGRGLKPIITDGKNGLLHIEQKGERTMSELIVEMKMPKRCGVCKCRRVEFDIDRVAVFCAILDNKFVDDPDSIPSWCPIKGVLPEEHGDLIDRDALFLKYREQYDFVDEEDILNAKTIIAAERKSE